MIWAPVVLVLGAGLTLALFICDQAPKDDLHWVGKWLLFPWLYIGLVLDVLLNVVVASAAFLEIPREWTLSTRVKRHIHEGIGYRKSLAEWIGRSFLTPIDPDHVK